MVLIVVKTFESLKTINTQKFKISRIFLFLKPKTKTKSIFSNAVIEHIVAQYCFDVVMTVWTMCYSTLQQWRDAGSRRVWPPMSLVLQDPSSSSAAGKVDAVGGGPSTAGPTTALHWDYSPKSMDADGATSNGGTCGAESVISELNGDCSTDDTVSLAQTAIIKQVAYGIPCDSINFKNIVLKRVFIAKRLRPRVTCFD